MIAHANGHPNIIAQFLVPFIAWRVIRLREPGRAVRNGFALGLLVIAQVFINEEILFIDALTLGMAILLAYLAVAHRRTVRAQIAPFLGARRRGAGRRALLAYPLWHQFFGPASYHGLNADLQDVRHRPGRVRRFAHAHGRRLASRTTPSSPRSRSSRTRSSAGR